MEYIFHKVFLSSEFLWFDCVEKVPCKVIGKARKQSGFRIKTQTVPIIRRRVAI